MQQLRIFLFGIAALFSQMSSATIVTVESGSQIWNRAISYGGPGGATVEETVNLTGTGVTSGSAANDHGSAGIVASISSSATSATFAMESLLTKTTTGRNLDNRMDVIFSLSSTVNYEITGSLSGTSTDAAGQGDRFDSAVSFLNLAGGTLFREDDIAFGTAADFSIDGLGSFTSGSATGVLGPGTYQLRIATRMIDFDADALGDANLAGGFSLNLNAISVPEPAPLLLLLLGILGVRVKGQSEKGKGVELRRIR